MNFVEITGGLGNQMFQYTFSKFLEKITGQTSVLYLNFYDYAKDDPTLSSRKFELDKFKTDFISVNGTINYRSIVYESDFDESNPDIILDAFMGYWQNKIYLNEVSDIIKREFTFKDNYLSDMIKKVASEMYSQNSVSIHVRRSDYLTMQNASLFASLSPDYYEKGLNIISDECNSDLKVYVFSDDPDYIRENFDFLRAYVFEIMPVRSAYEDMYLMTMCKHHIIANSTFSWWGAVLSYHIEGMTIAPRTWYIGHPNPNLYLSNWITI